MAADWYPVRWQQGGWQHLLSRRCMVISVAPPYRKYQHESCATETHPSIFLSSRRQLCRPRVTGYFIFIFITTTAISTVVFEDHSQDRKSWEWFASKNRYSILTNTSLLHLTFPHLIVHQEVAAWVQSIDLSQYRSPAQTYNSPHLPYFLQQILLTNITQFTHFCTEQLQARAHISCFTEHVNRSNTQVSRFDRHHGSHLPLITETSFSSFGCLKSPRSFVTSSDVFLRPSFLL